MLSPRGVMSRGRTAFHAQGKQNSFSPTDDHIGASGYMTPTQVLHQEFTLLNLNSPVFKIEKVIFTCI